MSGIKGRLTNRIEQAMARLEGASEYEGKHTVLVVDDEKGPRESLRMILSPQHRVIACESGPEALALLADDDSIAVLTVDLNMPGMKGDELMRTVRREHPHIEVIVITGYASVESAVDGLRHGVFDYLKKPFDVVEVSSTVRRAIDRRASRTQLLSFLQGIGRALGDEHDPEAALEALDMNPELRLRVRGALSNESASPSEDDDQGTSHDHAFLAALAEAIERREPNKRGHARRVAFAADLIAQRMSLPEARCEEIRVAAFLHDIGRVSASGDHVDHAETGARLVVPLGFPPSVAEAILHHHDRYDGVGVPEAPAGDQIPLASRILAVADEFDRLTHATLGGEATSPSEAIRLIRKQAGETLDPNIVRTFISIAELGLCAVGPLGEMPFEPGYDPIDNIAAAAAWIEGDR